jgi:hypothetical protein
MIEYIGIADANLYKGPVTGTLYSFGLLSRSRGFIDVRDSGLSELTEDGFPVFRLAAAK